MTSDIWDDARIAAAFRAAFDRDAPSGLADRILDEVRLSDRAQRRFRGSRWLAIAATFVVVVALAVGGSLGTPTVDPSASALTSTSPAPPTAPTSPITAAELPVISVEDAIAVRDLPNRSDELAVEGWMDPAWARAPIGCPYVHLPRPPLFHSCKALDLFATPVDLPSDTSGIAFMSLRPIGLDMSWLSDDSGDSRDEPPARVVVIGHFDDRRSALCVDGEPVPQSSEERERLAQVEQACHDQFVVDQFVSVDGRMPSQVFVGNTSTVWGDPEAAAALGEYVPTESILSANAVTGGFVGLDEPALADGIEDLTSKKALWIFRVLVDAQPARVDTYVVVDGIGSVFRSVGSTFERVDGWVEPTGPPYVSVDLDDGPGIGALAEIWDRSGTLIWRRTATADDPEIFGNIEGVRVSNLTDQPNNVRLTWYGGVCESYRIVIEARATIIRILAVFHEPEPPLLCPASATQRDLFLLFGQAPPMVEAELLKEP